MPRPAVLPMPEPGPRPTRLAFFVAPGLSRSSLSFMSLLLAGTPPRSDCGRDAAFLGWFGVPGGQHRGRIGDGRGCGKWGWWRSSLRTGRLPIRLHARACETGVGWIKGRQDLNKLVWHPAHEYDGVGHLLWKFS